MILTMLSRSLQADYPLGEMLVQANMFINLFKEKGKEYPVDPLLRAVGSFNRKELVAPVDLLRVRPLKDIDKRSTGVAIRIQHGLAQSNQTFGGIPKLRNTES